MKNITFLCGLLFTILFAPKLIGQDEISIPWKFNDDIPGQFDAITKDSEGLHGYLGDQIFTSTDNGDHWYFCEKNPVLSKYYLLSKDSLAMFYTEQIISYTTGGYAQKTQYKLYKNISCSTPTINNYSTYYEHAQHGGFSAGNIVSDIKIINNGYSLYLNSKYENNTSYGIGTVYENESLSWESTNSEHRISLALKDATNISAPYDYLNPFHAKTGNIFAHFDTTFVAIKGDSTFVVNDTSLAIIEAYENPFELTNIDLASADANNIFVVLENGTTYRSSDKGNTWMTNNLNLTEPIISYQQNHGFHVVKTASNCYISSDFITFNPFPIIGNNEPKDFYIFNSIILVKTKNNFLYRSLDHGASWDMFLPEGVHMPFITGLVKNETGQVYAIAGNRVYRQVCIDSFAIDYNMHSLSDAKDGLFIVDNQYVIRKNDKQIDRFNFNNYQWELWKSFANNIQVQTQGAQIFVHSQYSTQIFDINGNLLNSIADIGGYLATTTQGISLDYYPGYLIYPFNKETIDISHDNGSSWTFLQFNSTAGTIWDFTVHHDKFYLYNDSLRIFSDIEATPDTVIGLFDSPHKVQFSIQNDHLFVINPNETDGSIFEIKEDNQILKYPIPNLLSDEHQLKGLYSFYIDSASNNLISILGYNGLYTSKYAYLDTTTVNNMPTTNYSSCYGQELTIINQHYNQPGTYIQNGNSCNDDLLLNINYYYAQDSSVSGIICSNEYSIDFLNGAAQYTAPGSYQYILSGEEGVCDTIVYIDVESSLPVIKDTLQEFYICPGDSLTYANHVYLSAGTFPIDTISSLSNGCDSIISIIIIHKLYNPIENIVTQPIYCEGDYAFYNGQYYAGPNTYYLDTLTGASGCDSLIHILEVTLDTDFNFCVPTGTVFFDQNQNGIRDLNEQGISSVPIQLNPANTIIYSQNNGNYFWYSTDTTELLDASLTNSSWINTTDSIQQFHPLPSSDVGHNFGVYPQNPIYDGFSILSSNPTRCNRKVDFFLHYANSGAFTYQGLLKLTYDSLASFNFASIDPDFIDYTNHQIIWTYGTLYPFAEKNIEITFTMPDQSSTNTALNFLTEMYRDSSGTQSILDTYTYTPTVLCSFDPNDKQVMPSGERDEHYTLHGEPLTYTIRFQNTGNAEAIDIRILDTIDTDLDIQTLRIVNSSFPVQTSIKDRAVEFLFRNIWLPDSTSNEPESHGFVTYEIQPIADLDDYTEIKNTAFIIFDFNDAIVTNTTTNTMVTMIPVALKDIEKTDITIRPNPADHQIYISARNQQNIDKILIYNTLGKLVLAQKSNLIDVSHLPKGVYVVKVEIGDMIGVEKLVVE